MNRHRVPSPGVLNKLHKVLFRQTQTERVMPVRLRVLGWRKGERRGLGIPGAGGSWSGDGGGIVRVGRRMPEGAKVDFAYRTGYDGYGRVSVTHLVQRGCSAMLTRPEILAD